MSISIGKTPVRMYSNEAIDSFAKWELMLIVEENGWEEILSDWDHVPLSDLRNIIKTKMHEHEMGVTLQ